MDYKYVWIGLLFGIYQLSVVGNDYIVTQEMDTLFGEVHKIEADRVRMTTQADNKKTSFRSTEISSVYIEGEHSYYRSKLIPGKKEQIWLLKELISGKVCVYVRSVIITTGSGISGFEHYYIEKENEGLLKIPTDFLSSGENTRQVFIQLLQDDVSISAELDTLPMNAKNIAAIIKKYNRAQDELSK